MILVQNISAGAQSAPTTFSEMQDGGVQQNWGVGEINLVEDETIQFYQNHTDVFQILSGSVPAAQASTVILQNASGAVITTVLQLIAAVVPMTLDGTNAYGGLEIFDFPKGNITIISATTNLTDVTGKKASSGILTGASVVGAIGTVTAPAGTTLTSTAANIVPSTANTLTAYSGAMPGKSTSAQIATIDGNSTAAKAFLNFACGTANTTTDSMIVTGMITISWAFGGLN